MSELVVMARIGGRNAAVPAKEVRSVVDLDEIVPVPRAPAAVVGLAALRSRALTVIDTNRLVGAESSPDPGSRRAIVIDSAGHGYALLVEDVADVLPFEGDPAPVPGTNGPGWQRAARGMVETSAGPALLLDPQALLAMTAGETA